MAQTADRLVASKAVQSHAEKLGEAADKLQRAVYRVNEARAEMDAAYEARGEAEAAYHEAKKAVEAACGVGLTAEANQQSAHYVPRDRL